ncbi:sugar phosphate isomerase/epimerase family protein [Pasteurellaceae bacterium LIM206]|nr:sugar phosphate isomerase/epimerase family protein [Pasteurellaceae bacterium LIM206]
MFNDLKLAVNTSIYDGYDLDTTFKSIKNCGFDYFELAYNQGYVGNLNQDLFSKENAALINKLKEKYGLSTLALGCTMDLASEGLTDIFLPRFQFAKMISAKFINVCTTKSANKAKLIGNLRFLTPHLKATDCVLCLENGGDYNFDAFITVEEGVELLNQLDNEVFAFNFDPGNMLTLNNSLNVKAQSLASLDYCRYFHIKDVAIIQDKFRFVPIGQGVIDYTAIVPELAKRKIPCSFEIPLRIYRELDSTPKRFDQPAKLSVIEETLIQSREYIEHILES